MKKKFLMRWILMGLLVLRFAVAIAYGQDMELRGAVKDENGGAISGAEVKLEGRGQSAITDQAGEFSFKVDAGAYQIKVSAKGFDPASLSAETGKDLEITLHPQKIAEVVSISSSYLVGSPEALEQVSGSVGVIDKEKLENARVLNFSEALRKVSGVNVRDEEGFGLRPNIGIRGVNPTRSSKVLLLEDGLPLAYAPYGDNASYYHPPVERFESIEVLKGSGQIAYGPVTVAGVVNYLTPNPPDKPSFSLKLLGGNDKFFNGNASFGGTFGKTGLLLNFNRKQGEGARENTYSKLNDFSSKVTREINDRNFLTLKFSHFQEKSNVTYSGLTQAEYDANPRYNPFKNDFFYSFRDGVSANHTFVISPKANITTAFYGNYFSRDWWRQSSNSGQRPNRLNLDPDCRSMADLNLTCGNEGRLRNYLNFGFEPRFTLDHSFGQLQAGFRIHWEKQKRRQLNGDLPDSRNGAIAEFQQRKNLAKSAFLQNRFIFNKFALTLGARIENIEFQRQNFLNNGFGKASLTEIIPGAGITYNIFKKTTLFAGIHRGFAPPRTEDIISNTGGVIELDSELSWNYEAGIRSGIVRGLALEATYFRTDYSNQIVAASIAGGIGSAFTNGGKTLHQGFELSSRLDSSKIFNTGYNIYFNNSFTALTDAEFRGKRMSVISGFTNISVSGNRLPYAPKYLLNSSLGMQFRNFDSFIEGNYIGRQFSDDLNSIDPSANGQRGAIGPQLYWNATANFKAEKLKSVFFVTAKNIFDRTFIVDRARGVLPSSPRLIQAGIKINF